MQLYASFATEDMDTDEGERFATVAEAKELASTFGGTIVDFWGQEGGAVEVEIPWVANASPDEGISDIEISGLLPSNTSKRVTMTVEMP